MNVQGGFLKLVLKINTLITKHVHVNVRSHVNTAQSHKFGILKPATVNVHFIVYVKKIDFGMSGPANVNVSKHQETVVLNLIEDGILM